MQGREELSRRTFVGAAGALLGEGRALVGAAIGIGLGTGGCSSRSTEPDSKLTPPAKPDLKADTAADTDLGPIPRRLLGRTGEKVSILGLGTACMGEGPQGVEECAAVFAEAIDRGISYVDTARIYGDAEEALSRVLKGGRGAALRAGSGRRDKVFLVTKVMENEREAGQKSFETSLRTLGVDAVDLLHLHATGDRDLDVVLKPGGLWDYLLEMKKQGRTRFVGITGHSRPQNFLRMLATDTVDVMMVAMNFVDRHIYGFEDVVLPEARRRGVGIMGMKTFGGIRGGFKNNRKRMPSQLDQVFLQNAVRYSLGLEGLTGVVIGVHDAEELRQNIRFVLHAAPLSETEREALAVHGRQLAEEWGPRFGPVA
jgi:hypothetical protein